MEQNNRISKIESIRLGQFQADSQKYLEGKMGSSTSAVKARELITNFGDNYDKTFNVINNAQGNFAATESISNKLRNSNISDSANDIKNNLTTQLSNQVIESITGNSAVQLFKDNVFANASGQIYSLKGGGADLGNVLGSVKGITGNLNIGNIGSIAGNVSTVTNVYKNVMAGSITNVANISSIVANAKSSAIAGVTGAATSYLQSTVIGTGFSSLMSSIGAIKIAPSLGGSIGGAVMAIGKFFSDSRLKEDIKLVGKSPMGINIYSFKYKQLDGTYEGVMAQEVPWARQMTDTGFYMVDYSKVDVEFRKLN
jgi:hypothetical protein